jgi:hypothetical protein
MDDELEEPMRIVRLGCTGLYIEPDQAGSYLLHGSDGSVVAAPFTRDDAARFAREVLQWARRGGPAGLAREIGGSALEAGSGGLAGAEGAQLRG